MDDLKKLFYIILTALAICMLITKHLHINAAPAFPVILLVVIGIRYKIITVERVRMLWDFVMYLVEQFYHLINRRRW